MKYLYFIVSEIVHLRRPSYQTQLCLPLLTTFGTVFKLYDANSANPPQMIYYFRSPKFEKFIIYILISYEKSSFIIMICKMNH
jgi:hypothetical protein